MKQLEATSSKLMKIHLFCVYVCAIQRNILCQQVERSLKFILFLAPKRYHFNHLLDISSQQVFRIIKLFLNKTIKISIQKKREEKKKFCCWWIIFMNHLCDQNSKFLETKSLEKYIYIKKDNKLSWTTLGYFFYEVLRFYELLRALL